MLPSTCFGNSPLQDIKPQVFVLIDITPIHPYYITVHEISEKQSAKDARGTSVSLLSTPC